MTLWRTAPLGQICGIVSGGTPSRAKGENFGGSIPWVKISDMVQGEIVVTEETISDAGLKASSAKVLPSGTLLLSIFATVGRTAVLRIPAATNQAIVGITPLEEGIIDSYFLRFYLDSAIAELVESARGAAQVNINLTILKSLRIPIPPLPEQRRIATILDSARELRTQRRRSISDLTELVESDFEFRFGNVIANDRGWKEGRVRDLVSSFSSGKSIVGDDDAGNEFRVLKISAITKGTFDPTETKPLPSGYEPPEGHLVREGDLLISRANTAALVGATALVQHPVHKLVLPDKIWRFNWRQGEGDPSSYVWRAFSRPEFRSALSDVATGSGGSMKNISQASVLALPLAIPPIGVREQYTEVIEEFIKVGEVLYRHLAKLDELFASLQHRAFRGEL